MRQRGIDPRNQNPADVPGCKCMLLCPAVLFALAAPAAYLMFFRQTRWWCILRRATRQSQNSFRVLWNIYTQIIATGSYLGGWLGWLVTPPLARQPISCYYYACDLSYFDVVLCPSSSQIMATPLHQISFSRNPRTSQCSLASLAPVSTVTPSKNPIDPPMRHAQEVNEADWHVRLSHSKTVLNICLVKYSLFNSLTKNVRTKKVAHTRLPSVGFRSWSRFLAVSLQVT